MHNILDFEGRSFVLLHVKIIFYLASFQFILLVELQQQMYTITLRSLSAIHLDSCSSHSLCLPKENPHLIMSSVKFTTAARVQGTSLGQWLIFAPTINQTESRVW